MTNFVRPFPKMARAAAFATLLGSVLLAGTSYAAPHDSTAPVGPPNSVINLDGSGHMTSSTPDTNNAMRPAPQPMMAPPPGGPMHHRDEMTGEEHADHGMMKASPEDMKKHVDMRIKSLHDKLMITKDQEPAWANVANAMRDNETQMASMVEDRKSHAGNMTAVDDMNSYQKMVQAHADGIGKVMAPFQTLYGQMSDAQKQNADKVFGEFGKHMGMHHKHHMHAPKAK